MWKLAYPNDTRTDEDLKKNIISNRRQVLVDYVNRKFKDIRNDLLAKVLKQSIALMLPLTVHQGEGKTKGKEMEVGGSQTKTAGEIISDMLD